MSNYFMPNWSATYIQKSILCVNYSWDGGLSRILGNNSRHRTLPDIEFGMRSQISQKFYFQTILRKIRWQYFLKKITECSILGLLWSKYDQKWIFCNI